MNCKNCFFWETGFDHPLPQRNTLDFTHGECRHNSPTSKDKPNIALYNTPQWPVTQGWEWCGAWQAFEGSPRDKTRVPPPPPPPPPAREIREGVDVVRRPAVWPENYAITDRMFRAGEAVGNTWRVEFYGPPGMHVLDSRRNLKTLIGDIFRAMVKAAPKE